MSTEPYKLSPQRRAQIVKALQAGNTRSRSTGGCETGCAACAST